MDAILKITLARRLTDARQAANTEHRMRLDDALGVVQAANGYRADVLERVCEAALAWQPGDPSWPSANAKVWAREQVPAPAAKAAPAPTREPSPAPKPEPIPAPAEAQPTPAPAPLKPRASAKPTKLYREGAVRQSHLVEWSQLIAPTRYPIRDAAWLERCWETLLLHADHSDWTTVVGLDTLGRHMRASENTVRRMLRRLEEIGLVVATQRYGAASHTRIRRQLAPERMGELPQYAGFPEIVRAA